MIPKLWFLFRIPVSPTSSKLVLKRPAATFGKPRLNCDLNFVMNSSYCFTNNHAIAYQSSLSYAINSSYDNFSEFLRRLLRLYLENCVWSPPSRLKKKKKYQVGRRIFWPFSPTAIMGRFCSHLAKVDKSLGEHCSAVRTMPVRPRPRPRRRLMRLTITRTTVGFSPILGLACVAALKGSKWGRGRGGLRARACDTLSRAQIPPPPPPPPPF